MVKKNYFERQREEKEKRFLEYTDEELKKHYQYRNLLILWIVIGFIFSWTGVGIIAIIFALFF